MTFQPNLELREKVFRKMGWIKVRHNRNIWENSELSRIEKSDTWQDGDGNIYDEFPAHIEDARCCLPPIETSWGVCAEYLVPFMKGKGYSWFTEWSAPLGGGPRHGEQLHEFCWYLRGGQGEAEIKNDNIALAACEAFMEGVI